MQNPLVSHQPAGRREGLCCVPSHHSDCQAASHQGFLRRNTYDFLVPLFFSARRFEGVKWVAVNLQENPEMLRGEFSSFVSHLITTSNDKQAREEEVIVTDRT